MKKILTPIAMLAAVQAFAQDKPISNPELNTAAVDPIEVILPMLLIAFLVFALITLVRYVLEYRLKNKLVESGMFEQLSAYLADKNIQEKQHDAVKWGILFCGVGVGLTATYLTGPIHIHSLAIMAFSIGLSYLAYFCYLRK